MVVPLICRLDIYKFRNAVRRIVVPVILLRSDWSVCLEVNCGEAGCLIVNGSAVCLCIDTDPWTPPDHRLRCNRTLTGTIVDPDEDMPPDPPGISLT